MKHLLLFLTVSCLSMFGVYGQAEMLSGGNMESSGSWEISYLNSDSANFPVPEWNSSTNAPSSGSNGCLNVQSGSGIGGGQFAIYQKVTLSTEKVYAFDGAFKYTQLHNAWCEVFIGTKPEHGEDYGGGQSKLVEFSHWANPSSSDGKFATDGNNYKEFVPPNSGDYYFVIKTGKLGDGNINISWDEFSLLEKDPQVFDPLAAGGSIVGGEMTDSTKWESSFLNTATGQEADYIWNNTSSELAYGEGGNLSIDISGNAGTSQFAIFQKVNLSADSIYFFNGAFKSTSLDNAWCEAFIGTKPSDGSDYGGGQFKVAAFSAWGGPTRDDGNFADDAKDYAGFVPDESGEYYLVLKAGCNGGGSNKILLDQLSLRAERQAAIADFSVKSTSGPAPLEVKFTNNSKMSSSWEWNFGDGSETSTEKEPTHTYAQPGTYSVSLKASNELGDSTLTRTDYITVNEPIKLVGGGILQGGNMEDSTKWQTSILNTASEDAAKITWNETTNTPSAGQGGALYIEGVANGSAVQFAIYQQVSLSKDSVYIFNAAFKDYSNNSLHEGAWVEVFMGPAPKPGEDYGGSTPGVTQFANLSAWGSSCDPEGLDGTFEKTSCGSNTYIPTSDTDTFFVLKMGGMRWDGQDRVLNFAIDELSLTAIRTKPHPAFSADSPLGFPPLTVKFTDESYFATSWSWDFGDGSEASTEQHPTHEYATAGTYTVTLTATNEIGDTTLVKSEYIKVNPKPELPEGEQLYGGNMEDPNLWNVTKLNANGESSGEWNNTSDTLMHGEGGNLKITGIAKSTTSQYTIWQAVELTEGKTYTFTAAFRDLTENLDRFWSEVFISVNQPVDKEDYSKDAEGTTLIAHFNSWECGKARGLDGTYQDNACGEDPVGVFVPDSTGTYFFVIKTGNTDWENTEYKFTILIDEVSLMETNPPTADFFADITEGESPLTVNFTDLSENANGWEWHFGDGNTSTEQNPSHTYTSGGTYTVQLIAFNGTETDTATVEDLISVSPKTGLDDILQNELRIYPNPSQGQVFIECSGVNIQSVKVLDIAGRDVNIKPEITSNLIKLNIPERGLYLIGIEADGHTKMEKIIVQ